MPEPEKYVTPDQMRDVVDTINRGLPVDPASVNIGLSLSGQKLTLTKPDGTVDAVDLPSGGTGAGGETPSLAAADLDNLMGL